MNKKGVFAAICMIFLLVGTANAQLVELGGGYKHEKHWEAYFGMAPIYELQSFVEPVIYVGSGVSGANRFNFHAITQKYRLPLLPYATVGYGTRGWRFDGGARFLLPIRRSEDASFVLDVKYLYSRDDSHSFVVSFGIVAVG